MSPQQGNNQILTRGVAQVLPNRNSLSRLMDERKIRVYLGIDPTGSLLTLGHMVVLRKLQQFATLGHEVILLIGNGTVKIGDPTGKDSTRPELTDEQIRDNFKNWQKQASKVLDFNLIEIRYNSDWLDKLSYSDIVKLMAKTTVQQLMERDMFQERIKNGKPIFGHEIIYPLLQGYDSVEMDIDLEIGGTDQMFNMMIGRTLQKIYNNKEKWVLTTTIINGLDGRKMSKSYGNFIALTEDADNMYGKLMSLADDQIITYFKVLTDVSLEEIDEIKAKIKNGANPILFKKQLAFEITQFLHSTELAKQAQDYFENTVQKRQVPAQIPVVEVLGDVTAIELVKLCIPEESSSNVRRLIVQGGVKLNGVKLDDPYATVEPVGEDVVRIGKRKFFKIV